MRDKKALLLELDKKGILGQAFKLQKAIPDNGIISGDNASILQNRCSLITAELTHLIFEAECYGIKAKRLRDNCLNEGAGKSEEKSEAAKIREASSSPMYVELADERALAKALLNYLVNYKKFFDNAVYVMRSRQEKEKRDWQSTPTSETA